MRSAWGPRKNPHRVMNRAGAPCRALVAHTSADDQAGIVMLPELDAIHGEGLSPGAASR